MASDIGAYLSQRANTEADAAMQKLRRVAPWRRRRIQQLQNEIKMCESFLIWLQDAVNSGHLARESIENE